MHLRPPSIAHGITSFLWAFFLGLFIWIGGVAVGISGGIAFIAGCVAGFLIFLFVRVYGEDEPRPPAGRVSDQTSSRARSGPTSRSSRV
ncbi:MAG TPA: hypothetical protein VFA19_10425 [Gaiellaceae bacterium]|nr:hypothetical protein [Gaiellaceae bacterium]